MLELDSRNRVRDMRRHRVLSTTDWFMVFIESNSSSRNPCNRCRCEIVPGSASGHSFSLRGRVDLEAGRCLGGNGESDLCDLLPGRSGVYQEYAFRADKDKVVVEFDILHISDDG